ncbi:hypothetical protein CUJ84_pRLN2000027 (plasmid) [Rhizobium leguminosarum]|uniref:Uncharacterized protein n=1 Tax=Rhizobium leguminosarum TaxID=384 RepID=A0A2K9ZEA1_RHILE|nr:hypothetical protein CUJ84_pRLN2000027 [Rhizobium leguminosarum]
MHPELRIDCRKRQIDSDLSWPVGRGLWEAWLSPVAVGSRHSPAATRSRTDCSRPDAR